MAIIKCTECNHDVSDKADFCPNCGYSVSNILKEVKNLEYCKINGEMIDTTNIKIHLENLSEKELEIYKFLLREQTSKKMIKWLKNATKEEAEIVQNYYDNIYHKYKELNISSNDIDSFIEQYIENDLKPIEYNCRTHQEDVAQSRRNSMAKVHCPYCSSTNVSRISGIKKSASILSFGILSNKIGKQWHCNNCKSDF